MFQRYNNKTLYFNEIYYDLFKILYYIKFDLLDFDYY